MSDNMFLPRERYVIKANDACAQEDRILVVSPAIRSHLFHLLVDEARRLEADGERVRRKFCHRRASLDERATLLRALADEIAL